MSAEIKPLRLPFRHSDGSHILKVSVRAWIALILVSTVCFMSVMEMIIREPLYTLVGLAIGFYFGKNQTNPQK